MKYSQSRKYRDKSLEIVKEKFIIKKKNSKPKSIINNILNWFKKK